MKSLFAMPVVLSLVLAISHCAPGRYGTVDQYRPAFDSEDSNDQSDSDEYDSYYNPDIGADSDGVVEVLAVSEEPQDRTQIPNEEHATLDNRHECEYQTTQEQTEEALTTTNEPIKDVQTAQVVQ